MAIRIKATNIDKCQIMSIATRVTVVSPTLKVIPLDGQQRLDLLSGLLVALQSSNPLLLGTRTTVWIMLITGSVYGSKWRTPTIPSRITILLSAKEIVRLMSSIHPMVTTKVVDSSVVTVSNVPLKATNTGSIMAELAVPEECHVPASVPSLYRLFFVVGHL